MSTRLYLTYRAAAHKEPCPDCDAEPGAPCVAPSGQPLSAFHEARHEQAVWSGAPNLAARYT